MQLPLDGESGQRSLGRVSAFSDSFTGERTRYNNGAYIPNSRASQGYLSLPSVKCRPPTDHFRARLSGEGQSNAQSYKARRNQACIDVPFIALPDTCCPTISHNDESATKD